MLRNLQVKINKPVDTTYKAGETLIMTGMGVVKDLSNKTVGFPSAETAENIFFADKEKIATGVNAGRDLPDYEDEFNQIKKGEFLKLQEPESNERRATDQYVSDSLTIGDRMSVGTNGKWQKATNTINSKFVYGGTHTSDGHTLAIIEVMQDSGKNA